MLPSQLRRPILIIVEPSASQTPSIPKETLVLFLLQVVRWNILQDAKWLALEMTS
jgi:hypothetical protein